MVGLCEMLCHLSALRPESIETVVWCVCVCDAHGQVDKASASSTSPRLLSFLFLRNAAAMTVLKDGLSLEAGQLQPTAVCHVA